jgi:IS30 family transposase
MFRGNGERWTVVQDRQLLDLKKQGKSAAFIATAMGRTRSAVTARLSVLKSSFDQFRVTQKRSPWMSEEDERLSRLKEAGASWEEIADELGRPIGGIKHRWIALSRVKEAEE